MTDAALLRREDQTREAVVTKAVLRAADLLELKKKELARILHVSPSTITRLSDGTTLLEVGSSAYELALLLIRLYRALDSITGDDESSASWLRSPNTVLNARPIDLITSISGLTDTLAYVDQRRAPL